MNRVVRILIVCAPTLALLAGCAGREGAYRGLYAGLREKPEVLDARVLAGKRIVIDPGHGGSIGGAVGIDSLREADANLGVALYLWGLCTDAGADVLLTRTADRDYLPPGSTDVADDLKARVDRANEAGADVFVSIHHNSNLELKRDMNRIEVYYRSTDPGASLELAQDIEIHLARNLGIERSEVRPGNYFVLRQSTARAAVLGEASYLSHPAVERRLRLSEKQRLEAEAYFLGLVSYFSRGAPTLERLTPERDTLVAPADISFRVRPSPGVPIDPASVRLSIGASEVTPFYDPVDSLLSFTMDRALPNAPYTICAAARSTRGGTARSEPFVVYLARPPRHIVALAPVLKPDSIAALSVRVLDELGQAVADGMNVTARSAAGASAYSGETRSGMFTIEVPIRLARDPLIFQAEDVSDTTRFDVRWDAGTSGAYIRDEASGDPIANALVMRSGSPGVTSDPEGAVLIPRMSPDETLIVFADGYVPALVDLAGRERTKSGSIEIGLQPLFGGALRGRRIALDPGAGGADPGGLGAGKLRGASVNLATANDLRDLLTKAGATVTLTREGDETISAQERVYLVNRSGAELAIAIRHGQAPDGTDGGRMILHFPGSTRGALISQKLAAALATLPPPDSFVVRQSAEIFLVQTSCAACVVFCGSVEDSNLETLMADPRWRRLEAERMCAGIAGFFSPGNELAFTEVRMKATARGVPAAGAVIDVDNLYTRSADESGSALFPCITPGLHFVTVSTTEGRTVRFMERIEATGSAEVTLELP
jgi:N-acetylmuramoyl-L-alanine amidase